MNLAGFVEKRVNARHKADDIDRNVRVKFMLARRRTLAQSEDPIREPLGKHPARDVVAQR